ncbi:MAG TPA: hypothetical protein VFY25_13715 [Anaerolineales bacterium]|nr:hypothetical protein [Anaerolineales bacterium]
MKNLLTNVRTPAVMSLLLVLPFMILELVNRRQYSEGFPVALFGVMWLLPVVFLWILIPILRKVRAGDSLLAQPARFSLSVISLVIIAVVWTSALVDQMPCFLGLPFCD